MGKAVGKVNLLEPFDIDRIMIERDYYFPSAYSIGLALDTVPEHIWLEMFEKEWKLSRRLWDRKLYITGDILRLVTPPTDITEKIEWIQHIIKQTNSKVEEYNRNLGVREVLLAERARMLTLEEERENVEMLKDTLRKHFTTL
ncbi:MAG: hypothetical protein NWF11_01970 [Candidatus Bathyarchaeota archaeon]|nr:hypothetical protein [Candidatus Bathyarchaeota archaeon]